MTITSKDKYYQSNINKKSINALLDDVDAMLGRLDGSVSPLAERVFLLMDEIHHQMIFLKNDDHELEKIRSQYEYISTKLHKSAPNLVKSIGGKQKLQDRRNLYSVKKEHWWWFLDEYLASKRNHELKRAGIVLVIVLFILSIAALVYDRFIAPPPEVRARLAYESRISEFIDEGNYQAASLETEQALLLAPDYYPLWIKKGVLERVMGNNELEVAAYQTALTLANNPENFFVERSSVFMQFGLLDDLLEDANTLIEKYPNSPEGYLFIGMVNEERGNLFEANQYYETAYQLAVNQGKNQLAATIRVRMGMIMQSISIPTSSP